MGLTKAPNIYAVKKGFWIFTQWRVYTTKRQFFYFRAKQWKTIVSQRGPVALLRDGGRTLWLAHGEFYWDTDNLSAGDVELLIWDRSRRHDAKLDRLRKLRIRAADLATSRRERIPDDVRAFVWERDQGRCVKCGSEEQLQFDHIIPVAKGGGNGVENIQLLCADCNQLKSDSIV